MSKLLSRMLTVLSLVLALSLMFAIPSGAITEDAQTRYFDALWEEEEDFFDEEARREPIAVIANAVFSDILPAANVSALDGDLFAPGSTPIAENFTENGYRDETIIVEMDKQRMYDSDVFIAYVKIATPSQIRTAVAGKKMGSSSTNHTSVISKNYNGIVAINGDYYTKTKAGYIVRMGKTYREKTSKNMDLLLIDELGDFHIIPRGHDVQEEGIAVFKSEHEIVNGFFFGPGLVIDGEKQEIPEGYQFDPHQKNPRAGIAQLGTLTYALVVVNGRTNDSEGVTMAEFADIMSELGAVQAYNLDGGNSATLAFNGEVYNDKPQAERSVTDVIYFASAIGE
ncbi:MAG: phosphodiester glycosidase family protein [Clostridia bacterium]|nr:phosphodiester glycosidase family protein [Clostridia bacterium]MBR3873384.1 phosphodiester glycosidase family protein [Clostridia bacterium]